MGSLRCPEVDREEIVNACGVDDFHDGANVIRTACIVGMSKARETFEPVLAQLGARLAHVQRRMLPISMYLLQKEGALRAAETSSLDGCRGFWHGRVSCARCAPQGGGRRAQGSTCTGTTSSSSASAARTTRS